MTAALAASAAGAEVELVTPGVLRGGADSRAGGNTALAQGGIAAAIPADDSAEAHLRDTLAAGAGIVDERAARVLTAAGAAGVRRLLEAGFPVDRDAGGAPAFGLEGAHGVPRILHAGGDRTGAALHAHLAAQTLAAAAAGRLTVTERTQLVSLVSRAGVVVGARLGAAAATPRDCAACAVTRTADAVVLATGGYAALFPRHTNHSGARGEGLLAAARVGALLADLEFVQFHPTALSSGALVSEAVRGQGAVLRDAAGRPFMVGRHPLADLAPRDVVAREIHRVTREAGGETGAGVWLDATGIERERGAGALARLFPGIHQAVLGHGLDWTREPIPVAPAAHYTMGGVASDTSGRSSVPGLFVAGEVAATGVHGANRLASNSLLEGLVFGDRAGAAAAEFARGGAWRWESKQEGAALSARALTVRIGEPQRPPANTGTEVARAIAGALGIERDGAELAAAARVFEQHAGDDAALAALVCAAASDRRESRGAHQRADFPRADPSWAQRSALQPVLSPVAAGDPGTPMQPPERAVARAATSHHTRRSLTSC